MKTATLYLSLISIFIFSFNYQSKAQPGTLDSMFGNNGKFHYDSAKIDLTCFAIQNDGKFLIGGYNRGRQDPCVMRFNNDGTLDVSFGRRGLVLFDSYLGTHYVGNIRKIAVDKHNKVVICVSFYPGSKGFGDIGIIRLNNDGTLDTRFNKTGFSSFSLGYYHELTDMIIQSDNKIIVGGIVKSGDGNQQFHYLIRSLSDGKTDTSFGYKGIVRNYLNSVHSLQLALQPDGKIILSATVLYYKIQLERYKSNGQIDSSFGTNGTTIKLPTQFNYTELQGVALQSDGKIILTGQFDETLGVIRFNSDGKFDSSFNSGLGYYQYPFNFTGSSKGQTIFTDNNDKILVTGVFYWTIYTCTKRDSCNNALAVFRFSKNGNPDSSFGLNGIGIADFSTEFKSGNTGTQSGKGVMQVDGKIVVSGDFDNYVFSMARFNTKKEKAFATFSKSSNIFSTENETAAIKIYPNPAKNSLFIQGLLSKEKVKLSVIDLLGNVRIIDYANTDNYLLNVSKLSSGYYILKIKESKKIITKSFIKE